VISFILLLLVKRLMMMTTTISAFRIKVLIKFKIRMTVLLRKDSIIAAGGSGLFLSL